MSRKTALTNSGFSASHDRFLFNLREEKLQRPRKLEAFKDLNVCGAEGKKERRCEKDLRILNMQESEGTKV